MPRPTATPLEFIAGAGAGNRGTRLAWLVGAFERLQCNDALRGQLFDALQPFIVIRPGGSMLSRTLVRGLPAPTFFHRDGLQRQIDLAALLDLPLPAPRRLSAAERQHVVDAGRAMLAALGRETDAIALACPEGVRYYELGRGVAIALYTMRPERRSPLDSHVGMMLFKNGVPVGYGGGWPFLGTCKIGVNVFAPFRGGESALLFGQGCASIGNASRSGASSPSPRSSAARTRRDCNPARSGSTTGSDSVPSIRCRRGARREAWARIEADPGLSHAGRAAAAVHRLRHRASPRRRYPIASPAT